MLIEDKVLISFLKELCTQKKLFSTTLPDGTLIDADTSEACYWVNKALKYYEEHKVEIALKYAKKEFKRNYSEEVKNA